MSDENKISEAETEQADLFNGENSESKRKKISSELVMILLIGFLFGIAVKTEMSKRINVTDKSFYGKHGYNFVEMQKNLAAQQNSDTNQQK